MQSEVLKKRSFVRAASSVRRSRIAPGQNHRQQDGPMPAPRCRFVRYCRCGYILTADEHYVVRSTVLREKQRDGGRANEVHEVGPEVRVCSPKPER